MLPPALDPLGELEHGRLVRLMERVVIQAEMELADEALWRPECWQR